MNDLRKGSRLTVQRSDDPRIERLLDLFSELRCYHEALATRVNALDPQPETSPAGWLTLKQAAHERNCTPEAVRRRAVRGTLPARRCANGRWLIAPLHAEREANLASPRCRQGRRAR
jgi:hypothetical protein